MINQLIYPKIFSRLIEVFKINRMKLVINISDTHVFEAVLIRSVFVLTHYYFINRS